jgi:hypothetical protein
MSLLAIHTTNVPATRKQAVLSLDAWELRAAKRELQDANRRTQRTPRERRRSLLVMSQNSVLSITVAIMLPHGGSSSAMPYVRDRS